MQVRPCGIFWCVLSAAIACLMATNITSKPNSAILNEFDCDARELLQFSYSLRLISSIRYFFGECWGLYGETSHFCCQQNIGQNIPKEYKRNRNFSSCRGTLPHFISVGHGFMPLLLLTHFCLNNFWLFSIAHINSPKYGYFDRLDMTIAECVGI